MSKWPERVGIVGSFTVERDLDKSASRRILVRGERLTAEEARALARHLIDAADRDGSGW